MSHVSPRRPGTRTVRPSRRRADVEALIALVNLDQAIARREASAASALAIVEGTKGLAASGEREIAAIPPRDRHRSLAQLVRTREEAQTAAVSASTEPRDQGADLSVRRATIASRVPPATLADYENAMRHGLYPAAVATRGRVCWGCFHGLTAASTVEFHEARTFMCCPHCERVLFNPDWIEER